MPKKSKKTFRIQLALSTWGIVKEILYVPIVLTYVLHQVKTKALVLADMNAFLQRRFEEDESLRAEIEHLFKELQK